MNISTHTYKETQRGKEKATECLARPTKWEKKKKKRWQQQPKKNEEREREKKHESDDHAHAHAHIKNGTRDEVREK